MAHKNFPKIAGIFALAGVLAVAAPVSSLYASVNSSEAAKVTGTVGNVTAAKASGETFAKTFTVDTEELTYTCIAESSEYRLYVEEEYLSLVVENKETGAYMSSAIQYDDGNANYTWLGAMTSAVVLTMINNSDDTKQADLYNDDVTKTISYTEDGFSAKLYWTKYKLGLTLNVSLTDDGLLVNVPAESVVEDGTAYLFGTISLYPYMGNSYLDENEGYLFAPDGNGALIYLDDKEGRYKNGFSGMIYGSDAGFVESSTTVLLKDRYNTISDTEEVLAPIYGIAHTDDEIAYLAIVEEGEARASIEIIPNGVSVDYNRAYAKFILRRTYTQPTSNTTTSGSLHIYETDASVNDMAVRFLFLSGEDADYTGMAKAYRSYLLDRGDLVAVDSTYKTRVDFLGTERENFLLGTTAVTMTTVEDVESILADLEEDGVTDILSVYKGWQAGGLYNLPITKYKAASQIGGTKALTNLIKSTEGTGVDLYLYDDALLINPSTKNATFNVVKKVNKRKFELTTYMDVYDTLNYITPARSSVVLGKFTRSYTSKGVDKLAVAGISNTLFTYNYNSVKYTRYETQASYADTIASLDEDVTLILEQPVAYLWKNTEAYLDMPLYTSSYIYEDESIPFLSIVLKGILPIYSEYVNFEANKQEFFLKMVESGTYPSFYITEESSSLLINTNSADIYSSEYSSYEETIVEYDEELSALNALTEGATIDEHEILASGVVRVTYTNGVTIYINYNEKSVTADGLTLDAMSYEVVKS